jgi:hypothetical protein
VRISTLGYMEASGPEDAGDYMWTEDMGTLEIEQDDYERRRTEAALTLRQSARELMGQASVQSDPQERERLIQQAIHKSNQANDPLPVARRALEALEQVLIRSCGRPAVLVRPSLPMHREVYHRDETCGLISGKGRGLEHAGWAPLGVAEAAGYRPCERCGGAD